VVVTLEAVVMRARPTVDQSAVSMAEQMGRPSEEGEPASRAASEAQLGVTSPPWIKVPEVGCTEGDASAVSLGAMVTTQTIISVSVGEAVSIGGLPGANA
jgi:hypothetical protein